MNVWKQNFTPIVSFLVFWLIWIGVNTVAMAQNEPEKNGSNNLVQELPGEQVGDHASDLLRRLKFLIETGERYTNEMKEASEEDRLVLSLQSSSLQRPIMDILQELADALLSLEEKTPQPELRRQVEDLSVHALPRLTFHITHLRSEIDLSRARRTEAKADERYTIENEVADLTTRLDELFDMNLRYVQKMESVGVDTKKHITNLTTFLYDRADELSGRMALSQTRIDDLTERCKEFPDDTDAAKLLIASIKSLNTNAASMEATLDLMDELEMDTETFRGELMTATRDFSSGLMNTGVAVSLANRTFQNIADWLVEKGPKYIIKLIIVIGIILVFRFATRIVRAGLGKAIESSKLNLSQLARRLIVNTVSNMVMVFGLLLALSQLGISLGPLLAGLGVAGFIIGFALQDTLGNFASGMMILMYRPYDVGDLVDVCGVLGKVDKMNLVSTSLLTVDNQLIVIPNNKIWGDVIKNVTAQEVRRIDMVFGISYSDDIPKAESIMEDILKSHDKVLNNPEPMVRLHVLGSSSVDFVVRPWVKVDDYWDVYWDVTRTIKMRFDEEGVSIPFPQRDVHIYNNNSIAPAT